MNDFSHLDKSGNVRMVDVTDKIETSRTARAEGKIFMKSKTISAVSDNTIPKLLLYNNRIASLSDERHLNNFTLGLV